MVPFLCSILVLCNLNTQGHCIGNLLLEMILQSCSTFIVLQMQWNCSLSQPPEWGSWWEGLARLPECVTSLWGEARSCLRKPLCRCPFCWMEPVLVEAQGRNLRGAGKLGYLSFSLLYFPSCLGLLGCGGCFLSTKCSVISGRCYFIFSRLVT